MGSPVRPLALLVCLLALFIPFVAAQHPAAFRFRDPTTGERLTKAAFDVRLTARIREVRTRLLEEQANGTAGDVDFSYKLIDDPLFNEALVAADNVWMLSAAFVILTVRPAGAADAGSRHTPLQSAGKTIQSTWEGLWEGGMSDARERGRRSDRPR